MKRLLAMGLALLLVLALCACESTPKTQEGSGEQQVDAPEAQDTQIKEENPNMEEQPPVSIQSPKLTSLTTTMTDGAETWQVDTQLLYEGNTLVGIETYRDGQLIRAQAFLDSYDLPLSMVEYDDSGGELYRNTHTYDQQNRLLQSIYTEGGQTYHTLSYQYTDSRKVETDIWWFEDSSTKTVNTYDASDNLIEDVFYSDGEEIYRNIYQYNSTGLLVEEITYTDGEESDRFTYEYNDRGHVVKETNGDGTATYEYTYNDDSQILRQKRLYDGQSQSLTVYEYDDKGNCVLEAHFWDGEEEYRYLYTFNEDNKITESLSYHYGREGSRNTYTYNEDGLMSATSLEYFGQSQSTVMHYDFVDATQEEAQELQNTIDKIDYTLFL